MVAMRVAGLVAYDGTHYRGFQRQAQAPTIQGILEQAVQACTGQAVRVEAAGRTDAGVHASGQVIAADVEWRHGPEALRRAWNAHLPAAVVLRQLCPVSADFRPRYHALARTYRYHVLAHPSGSRAGRWPLMAHTSWYIPRHLDADAMNRVARRILGTHDFAGFGRAPDGGTTVRTLMAAHWCDEGPVTDDLHGTGMDRLVFTITANAFLYRMVRRVVAALVKVGQHEWGKAEIEHILHARNVAACPPPAPAQGLVLCQVTYARPITDMEICCSVS